ncbi:uncharacterized protein LOC126975767 isoform X2 [Leptidea sinapis]|uniref:uncharacterized protein LOC126975767 isoform X2 n=1 Tax=Leptidea sinapis TaxID=189913 RepID=UPI0021C2D60D|nr:uncharacterized protein LOC126975767 isoform X2 [Leptidea sinapis]
MSHVLHDATAASLCLSNGIIFGFPTMFLRTLFLISVLQSAQYVLSAKQKVELSESYLPVAMQIIAHLTDQMAFEVKDDVSSPPAATTARPLDITTQFHKPGLYAPPYPPKPSDRIVANQGSFVLLPVEHNSQYTLIEPQEKKTDEPLLEAHNDEVKPILEPAPNDPHLLPPFDHDLKVSSRSGDDDVNEENLQYLSQNVRDMIKMAQNPDDDRLIDVWDGLRANPAEPSSKGKLSSSNLRLLLLYDLLSRDAKKQRLSDYTGFSPNVMKDLVDSSSGGAREQLKMALAKMVERNDCTHDYANNRAKEMVTELGQDESKLSSELRYLQPLVYKY